MKFYIHTLGCPKNEVDSEGIANSLIEAGHKPADDFVGADIVIVNTCGFIETASEESLQVLREVAALKSQRSDKKLRTGRARRSGARGAGSFGPKILIAAGCLVERLGASLLEQVEGLDGIVGTRRWAEVSEAVERAIGGERPTLVGPGVAAGVSERQPHGYSAYVKIADGCNAGCAFCAIPGIKGPYHSQPVEQVLSEVRQLVQQGVQEIVLIAQDTTAYGRDWGREDGLAALLDEIVAQEDCPRWIRILYAYPQFVSARLLETMARHSQIVKYLDIPLQHSHSAVLQRMRRPHGDPREVIGRIREAIPGISLRTTLIVGFPGETDDEFKDLLRFVEEARFDRLGAFKYSREQGTAAYDYADQVPEKIKARRFDQIMRLQQRISEELHIEWVGKNIDVLIEGPVESDEEGQELLGQWFGRSFRDAPEIDGLVFVNGDVQPGQIVPVRIVEALQYDLVGIAQSPVAGE